MSDSREPRILLFFGVYEAERSFAAGALAQLLDIWSHCDLTVHIQDDASPSYIGEQLAQQFSERVPMRITRFDRSLGYFGTYERCFSFLHGAVVGAERYDWVVRIDTDAHLTSRKLANLFDAPRLPQNGLIGHTLTMRHRDFLLWIADLAPAGMRRKPCRDGRIERRWEPRAWPVWWSDIGWAAMIRGFRGRIGTGALQILAWPTLIAMHERGWLSRPRRPTGLMLQDDTLLSMMVHALGHPIVDIRQIIEGWNGELFLASGTPIESILARRLDFLHPLKDSSWAQEVRAALPLPPPEYSRLVG